MKYGINKVTLVGNVGEVPRVSEKDGEAFVANFPLATNEYYRDKEGEEVQKTNRRVNALEQVFIPALGDQVRFIRMTLDERAREDLFRLKKVKKSLEKKKKEAGR